jgi:hypothetical protein
MEKKMKLTYQYPKNGQYNETVAIDEAGRRYAVNTQYATVHPQGKHAVTCSQVTKMGGRCDCGLLVGIDTTAMIADARLNGLFGPAPAPASAPAKEKNVKGICPQCHTYCNGDCQS